MGSCYSKENDMNNFIVLDKMQYSERKYKSNSPNKSSQESPKKYKMKDLKLQKANFYKKELKIKDFELKESYKTYQNQGPYRHDIDPKQDLMVEKCNGVLNGKDSVYLGELKDGKPYGVGIAVSKDGDTGGIKEVTIRKSLYLCRTMERLQT